MQHPFVEMLPLPRLIRITRPSRPLRGSIHRFVLFGSTTGPRFVRDLVCFSTFPLGFHVGSRTCIEMHRVCFAFPSPSCGGWWDGPQEDGMGSKKACQAGSI